MAPGQLNKAANSLRPSSILEDEDVESEPAGNGELERDEGGSGGEESGCEDGVGGDSGEEVQSEEEVNRVNKEEIAVNGDSVHGNGERSNGGIESGNETSSDVELVIDYGGSGHTYTLYHLNRMILLCLEEEMEPIEPRVAALTGLVHKKKDQRLQRCRARSEKKGKKMQTPLNTIIEGLDKVG